MALQLATFIITNIIVANQFAWFDHPVDPTEIKLMAVDNSLTEFFLDVPEVVFGSYYAGHTPGLAEYMMGTVGFNMTEVIDYLKEEHDLCVVLSPPVGDGQKVQEYITFTRSTGVTDAPGTATSMSHVDAIPNFRPAIDYLGIERSMKGDKWLPYYTGTTLSINPFTIDVLVEYC